MSVKIPFFLQQVSPHCHCHPRHWAYRPETWSCRPFMFTKRKRLNQNQSIRANGKYWSMVMLSFYVYKQKKS